MAKRRLKSDGDEEIPKAKFSKENLKKSLRLFTYLGQQKWKFFLGMLFLGASAGIGLIFPLLSGKMFSFFGETSKPQAQMELELFGIGKILLIILLAQGVISFGRVYMFAQVTENLLKGLRNDTFKRLVQMPMGFFSKNQVSELSSRMATDINVISEAFTINIAELIRQTIVGFGGLILLVYYTSWDIAQWFLIIIPPLTTIAILFSRRIRKFSKAFQDKIAESNVIVGEALTGIASVKIFTNEKHEIRRYEQITSNIRDFGKDYWTGTVYTTNRRVWEHDEKFKEYLRATRAIAIDMETATLFSAGFYNSIPIGALLLVSDMPLMEEGIKTDKSDLKVTTSFVEEHIKIGVKSLSSLINNSRTVKHLRYE